MSYMDKFLINKYSKWYFSIIENAKNRVLTGYKEKHHILPACMGGERRKYNMVALTAREHFIVHCLLVRCVKKEYKSKMWSAVWLFSVNPSTEKRYVNSRQIEIARIKIAERNKKMNTGTKRPHKESTKDKIRIARSFQKISKESYEKQSKTISSLVWMNDGNRSFRINPSKVEEKIKAGLAIGRIINFTGAEFREKMRIATSNHWESIKRQSCHI